MKRKKFIKQLMGQGLPRNIASIAAKAVEYKNAKYSDVLEPLLELREWAPFGRRGKMECWRLAVLCASINILKDRPLEEMPKLKFTISPGGGCHE